MKTQRQTIAQKRLALAEKLAQHNDGLLPTPWKLIQMGHGGLYRYMRRNPNLFSQFPKETAIGIDDVTQTTYNIAIREEHINTAKKLMKSNKGKMPDVRWLQEKGYTRLAVYMRNYPHVFKNLGQNDERSGIGANQQKRRR